MRPWWARRPIRRRPPSGRRGPGSAGPLAPSTSGRDSGRWPDQNCSAQCVPSSYTSLKRNHSAAWRSHNETHGFASPPHDGFAFVVVTPTGSGRESGSEGPILLQLGCDVRGEGHREGKRSLNVGHRRRGASRFLRGRKPKPCGKITLVDLSRISPSVACSDHRKHAACGIFPIPLECFAPRGG
jgi:hypothetical protein